jgi:hypothetical protein
MPTHAMRLHEWGTRGTGLVLCVGHPPTRPSLGATLGVARHKWIFRYGVGT